MTWTNEGGGSDESHPSLAPSVDQGGDLAWLKVPGPIFGVSLRGPQRLVCLRRPRARKADFLESQF